MSKAFKKGNKKETTFTTIRINRRTGDFALTQADKVKDLLLLNMATYEQNVF